MTGISNCALLQSTAARWGGLALAVVVGQALLGCGSGEPSFDGTTGEPAALGVRGDAGGHEGRDPHAAACGPERFRHRHGYRAVKLSEPSGGFTSAFGINERGAAAGNLPGDAGQGRAVAWIRGAEIDLGTLGGTMSVAFDINDREQVVGYSTTPDGRVAPFIWEKGVMREIPGVPNGEARGINDHGDVVGTAIEPGSRRAFVFDGHTTRFLTDRPNYSDGRAINDRGEVAGSRVVTNFGQSAFRWKDGVLEDLPGLGGNLGAAWAINNAGEVVGVSSDGSAERAVLWTDGGVVDLGANELMAGHTIAMAHDINDRHEIVGHVQSISELAPVVAFYYRAGCITTLNARTTDNTWPLNWADAINDRGVIVGHGIAEDWRGVALMWVPR